MYFRMILVMVVTIYTSRVILDKLGIDDYGHYNAITSVVAMIAFLNMTLSTSTSRFLTFDLGAGNRQQLQETFSTTFFTHLFLALVIMIIMETVGLWYMNYKFVIPEGREFATQIVFQISILTTLISICIVPYTALITAHEDLNIYAYVGILDVSLRLAVVYLLSLSPIDKLITYAFMLLIVQILIATIYVLISFKKYAESRIRVYFSRKTFGKMIGFTGWTAVANLSNTFSAQGSILLLNLFFAPAVIAAKALADQVTTAIMQFVNNFRIALNPQIIKSYAANEKDESKRLTLKSTVISFDLMLIMGLPFIFTMDTVLGLWLKEVPVHAVLFTQLTVLAQIINTISSSTYIAFVSSGKLKNNAIWAFVTGLLFFIILYIIFRRNGQAVWVQYLYLIFGLIGVFILRPWLLKKDVDYSVTEVMRCNWDCFKVLLSASGLSWILASCLNEDLLSQGLLFGGVGTICVICSYLFMDKTMKYMILDTIKKKMSRNLN